MIQDLVAVKRSLMQEWKLADQKFQDSGDDWYTGVLSGLEVAMSTVDTMIEHEDDHMNRYYEQNK
jgi:hypothetical protein